MAGSNDLGATITRLRGDMSQRDLGRAIGLSRQRVSQLETGRKSWPTPEVFNALARTFNVPVTELLRAAGIVIPELKDEKLAWIVSQLDAEGIERLGELGHAILPRHLRPQETAV